jgi:probable F420-dependent oxidoreductase
VVEYGAHLPLIDLGAGRSLPALKDYARAAAELGFRYLCANDHLVFRRPWLDGPTALAALIDEAEGMRLATTVSLPVLRGPAQLAKTLAAIDVLSEGRLVVGVGPGSSAADYAAAGVPFDQRWRRFDEAVRALRALLRCDPDGFDGEFHSTRGVVLEPRCVQRPGPPIWIASWGSPAGLRRVARLGDGWIASAYNTTPARFGDDLAHLSDALRLAGRATESFPAAIATTWLHVTEDPTRVERMLADVLAPMLHRPVEELRGLPLPIGPAEVCAERLAAYVSAGARRIFVWPLHDEVRQLELFRERVVPLVEAAAMG